MPLVSVIVPIYNTEAYLRECLESVAAQTVDDLEVVMVDDGSTDGSAQIASEFAARDSRFRLITQPNGGLGNARNTGADHATGDFIAFVDSDDVLPHNAYELLVQPLRKTGSDFATGNVQRLTSIGTSQARFLAKVFVEDRPRTHITRFRPLLADRIVPNKLWRRSFWEKHGFRFPEGMVHEDIPVVLPAQFAARSVDVVADPVYLYRIREGMHLSDQSITQRRLDQQALLDRVRAVTYVRDYLAREGPRKARRWYEQSVVAEDLMYFLNVLDNADDDYREVFLDRVNAFLDGTGGHVFDELKAIDRLKWHFVRRRLMPELLEVLRFQKERLRDTPPLRVGRRWYGDYPYRGDRALGVPSSVYRLDQELSATPHVDVLRWDGDELEVDGFMYISGIGAPAADSQRVSVTLLRRGRFRAVRQRIAALRLQTVPQHRPDATANSRQALCDLEWSGFHARLDARRLRRVKRRGGTWDLYVTVRAGGLTRRRVRFHLNALRPVRAAERLVLGGPLITAAPSRDGGVSIRVRPEWAMITSHRVEDGVMALSGRLRVDANGPLELRAVRQGLRKKVDFSLVRDGDAFSVQLPLDQLGAPRAGHTWDLFVVGEGKRLAASVADEAANLLTRLDDVELALERGLDGTASLAARAPHAVLTGASWLDGGVLHVEGDRAPATSGDLVLYNGHRLEHRVVPLLEGTGERFAARFQPARVPAPEGELALREGVWELYLRPPGASPEKPASLIRMHAEPGLGEQLPLRSKVGHKSFALGLTFEQHAMLAAHRDLDDGERGGFHQRRLREHVYERGRSAPLREAIVYSSFGGQQYSDNPRAIHEELVRRETRLEHVWVVRDAMFRPPAGATVVRDGSREHYEAMASARFIVTNDHFPDWFSRRPDQICLQTWHGTPLKRLGFDMPEVRKSIRRAKQRWGEQAANWQYVLSPNHFSTPILQRAYAIEGEMLETGYPRIDRLVQDDRDQAGRRVRERLGIPDGIRTILYAPTYRDHIVDGHGRYRLDMHLDVERLRSAVGRDSVLLFRKHHRISDVVPATGDGFVRDVSGFPDASELLLAADVLVTDYSSMMFDFANTGRPILFFVYDLDAYRDQVRGFYFDFERQAPGPLVRTSDELAAALADVNAASGQYAERYAEFVASYCELDDGSAAARVADRVFMREMASTP